MRKLVIALNECSEWGYVAILVQPFSSNRLVQIEEMGFLGSGLHG